jgi:hypothetical protein
VVGFTIGSREVPGERKPVIRDDDDADNNNTFKSRRMRWVGHVAHMGEGRGVYGILVGRPEGKRPLGKSRCR